MAYMLFHPLDPCQAKVQQIRDIMNLSCLTAKNWGRALKLLGTAWYMANRSQIVLVQPISIALPTMSNGVDIVYPICKSVAKLWGTGEMGVGKTSRLFFCPSLGLLGP